MFHLVSLSLQISLNVLPGPCLGLCVGVACFVGFVGLVVGFFLWGNLISITGSFQLLTDHVAHLSGNAGKKKSGGNPDGPERRRRRPTVQIEGQTTQEEFSSSGNPGISSHRGPGTVPVEQPMNICSVSLMPAPNSVPSNT